METIQKLNWAGIKISTNNKTILIDAVEDFSTYKPVMGNPEKEIITFSETTQADYIIFTHLHLDHFDLEVIKKCLKPNGKLIVYSELEKDVKKLIGNIEIKVLKLNDVFIEDDISFKPVFAMDGIGDIQSSWIITTKYSKIFHGGDTIWHNQFWKLGKENENIDYAFLPANGVIVNFEVINLDYSSVPASLTIEQAFNAANLLHAKKLIPIHYDLFEHNTFYIPQKFNHEDMMRLSRQTHQNYLILNDGEFLK